MHYLTLLYDDEANATEPGTPAFDAEMEAYGRFDEIAGAAIAGGEAMELSSMPRTVRSTPDGPAVTAGPFAETSEVLGGFYVLDAESLDGAIELARHIPAASTGAVEIRPMVQWVTPGAVGPAASGVPRWMCTIHGPEGPGDDPANPEWADGAEQHHRFGEAAGDSIRAAGSVHSSASATTIRVRDGELMVSDGPFAEAIEVVGGFYVLAGDDATVLELAGRIPTNEGGAIEVRPIMVFDG